MRCIKHGLTFVLRILSDPKNPCYNIINTPRYGNLFNINKHLIPSFGLRIRPHIINSKLNTSYISKIHWPLKGLWTLVIPSVYLGLSVLSKVNTNPSFFLDKYRLLKSRYKNYQFIYTDGSKTDEAVAAAAVCNGNVFSNRLPKTASIFSAEAKAILLALNFIECTFHNQFVIFSDSKSVLQAIQNLNWKNPLIYSILKKYDLLYNSNKRIVFFWIPSHIGIIGNEKADYAAKEALKKNISNFPLPSSDFKHSCSFYVLKLWQANWGKDVGNKLLNIKPKIGETPLHSSVRREDVVITRLRIGHSYFTHSHLLLNIPNPVCSHCKTVISVKHLILDCPLYENYRYSFQLSDSIFEFFQKNHSRLIIDFLKRCDLFSKI